jgi:chromosome segregation ATPase
MDEETQKALSALRAESQATRDRLTRVETIVEYNVKAVDDFKAKLEGFDAKLDVIRQDIAQARGSAGTIKWIIETLKLGGAGGLGAWLASHFGGSPPPGAG